ncbi:ephrin-A1-like [Salvelinus alpinus]
MERKREGVMERKHEGVMERKREGMMDKKREGGMEKKREGLMERRHEGVMERKREGMMDRKREGVMEREALRREGYTVQVNVNDYLDIYCPHYNDSQRVVGTGEQYILYMVSYRGYRTCDPQLGFKRWECNRPHAPIKFSEKFQRYSAFSLGYEFHVGQEYYYIFPPILIGSPHCQGAHPPQELVHLAGPLLSPAPHLPPPCQV